MVMDGSGTTPVRAAGALELPLGAVAGQRQSVATTLPAMPLLLRTVMLWVTKIAIILVMYGTPQAIVEVVREGTRLVLSR